MRPPRFEPGSPAWEADVLDQARLRPLQSGLRTSILNLLINLRSRGLSESSLKDISAKLRFLANNVDLNNSEAVNRFISSLGSSGAYKHNLVKVYGYYVRGYNLEWNRPRYRFERNPIRIPSEQEVNSIIENSSKRYSVIFTLLKETGAMPYELSKVQVEDVDLDRGLLSVRGFKGHTSRTFKLKSDTLSKLNWYIRQYCNNKALFPRSDCIGKTWRRTRDYVAKQIPSVKAIHLYHLRHLFASSFYHRHRDPILLMTMMGHKKLERVMTYVQLLGSQEECEWTCKTARTVDECKALIESGFEYVSDCDGYKLFRKRK